MSPSHDPWIGRVIAGRYEVLRLLGQGSMALVYLARDRTLGRDVVLKRPHPALLVLEGFPERFRREVQALARQEQLHVVRVLDAGDDDGTPWMALPHLSGGSLADRIAGAPRGLAPAEVAAWLPDVARALDAVHASGWVHRDVKPGNVLFDAQGRVALSDFGIARALGEGEVRLTSTGMPPGSPAYMAPEQAEGLAVSGRTDQYALAVTVYEALCGRLPHVGTDPLALLLAKSQRPARPLHEVRPDLPAGVGAAVERALAHDPAARFSTCAALAEAFVSSLGGRPERRRGLARRRGGLAAAALAVVALAVGWALRAGGREGAPAPAVPSWAQVSSAQVEAARALGVPVAYENPLGMRFVLIPAGTFTIMATKFGAWPPS